MQSAKRLTILHGSLTQQANPFQSFHHQYQTPLWRPGPTAKPVLCNACGLRWQTKETLDDYLPKHASTELPSEMKLEVGEEVSGQDGSSACLEEEMINISSLGSAGSSPDKCMQMEETNVKGALTPGSVLCASPRFMCALVSSSRF
ncbi:hypothetical protein KY290_002882 [Solanum tuberosum]|uniref:GATA-type domain-containing protein n=1 Tax=Solanum tuberosum TaxID=4113 RepID=A0ABQ7WTK1_SOLTU|nr:hypothetical protein KY290_002882 [Solanum tuberosum]